MKSKPKVLHDFRAFCIVLCVLLSCVRTDRTTSTLVRGWVCPSFQRIVAPDLVQNWRAISWGCTSGRFHGLMKTATPKCRGVHCPPPSLHHPHAPLVSNTAATTLLFRHSMPTADGGTGWINVHDFTQAGFNRLVEEKAGALVRL